MVKDFEIIDGKYIVRDVVACYDVDSSLRIRPVAFMNIAQEMATRAADHLGFGYSDLISKNMAWVVSRMYFRVVDVPRWKDELVVATWHKGVQGPFFVRDFSVCGADGSPKILATSSWVVLDTEKRSMIRISDVENMIPENSACYENAIDRLAPKIMIPRGSEPRLVQSVKLGYSDIDMNAHTNNARYVQYAMNCFDFEELRNKTVSELFITFNHETYAGEVLDLYMVDNEIEGLTDVSSGKSIVRSTTIEGKVGDRQAFCAKIIFVACD
jgi:acyl-ACP thioesterase